MEKKNFAPSIVLAIGLILSAYLVSNTFYKVKALDDNLSVTGSAKKSVKADLGKISGSFSRTVNVNDLKIGYDQMSNDLKNVKKFFKDRKINEKDLVISPVFMDQQDQYNKDSQAPQEYTLRQTVELQLKDVDKITSLARDTQELIKGGVLFSTFPPEYYYTDLAKARIDLLSDAVKDARDRANKIAESGGKSVDNLKSASVGITQVTSVNSIDSISDWGTYDTSKIDKDVMITVKAVFGLK